MEDNDKIFLIPSIIVMCSVIFLDQLVAPWPVEPTYFFGIILYKTYLVYYLLGFLIGAGFFYILCNKYGYDLDIRIWMKFTRLAFIITLPCLVFVVYVVSRANILFIIFTDVFSLTLVFLPAGLSFGAISTRLESCGTKIVKIDENIENKTKIRHLLYTLLTGITINIIS